MVNWHKVFSSIHRRISHMERYPEWVSRWRYAQTSYGRLSPEANRFFLFGAFIRAFARGEIDAHTFRNSSPEAREALEKYGVENTRRRIRQAIRNRELKNPNFKDFISYG